MRTPNKKTLILAGAFSAGLIAVGGTLAVADGLSSTDPTTAAGVSSTSAGSDDTTTRIAPPPASTPTAVSRDQATRIALGLVPGARVVEVDLDRGEPGDDDPSDRVTKWEVDLVKGNLEYDIDIDAQNGDVRKNRSEADDDSDARHDNQDDDRDNRNDDRDHHDDSDDHGSGHGGDHDDDQGDD